MSGVLNELTATELLRVYARGEASPLEVVDSCLARIEEAEPVINAIVTLCAERCREQARLSDKRWRRSEARALEGIPFGAKDIIATAGVRTTGGSSIFGDYVPEKSAIVVDRLEKAGAILLAKTQTYEFAIGDNSHYGPTRSPWEPARTPGGSSTGSAAALAAGEMPVALGTDTGGSIRVPATFSGIVGFKPTLGRVPRTGVMFQSWTLDHVGPMARSVEDIARLMNTIAGHDPLDPMSLDAPVPDFVEGLAGSLKGLTIAIPRNWFFDVIDPEMEAATRAAGRVFEEAGAQLIDADLPSVEHSDAIGWVIMYAEYAALHEITFGRLDEYSAPLSQEILASAPFISAVDYLRALRAMHLLQKDFEKVLENADAILVPGMAGVAPYLRDMQFEIEGRRYEWGELVARMTMVFNLVGMPALALPAGLSVDGLPLGIQIGASPFADKTCLRIGHAYQIATDHHRLVPVTTERWERSA